MKHNPIPVSQIPEVQDFEIAKQRLQQFKDSYRQFFDLLDPLVEDYNQKLEAADKAVRAKEASCGDFELFQKSEKIDGEALHNAVGRPVFISIGGTVKTTSGYKVDGKRLLLAVAQGKIPQTTVDAVTTTSVSYHTPKPAALP